MELAELDGDEAAAEELRKDEDGATPEEAEAEDESGEADEGEEEPAPTAEATATTPDASEAETDVPGAQGPASNLDSPNVESEDDLVVVTKKGLWPFFLCGEWRWATISSPQSQPTHSLCLS